MHSGWTFTLVYVVGLSGRLRAAGDASKATWSYCHRRSKNRWARASPSPSGEATRSISAGRIFRAILLIMTALFLALGYLGVPVAFSLMAGVIVGTMLTPISLQSIVGQAFNGVDSEALMAIPFFLLVGELMTSANVVVR